MISVIIAALNAERWLDDQLDALERQTFDGHFEVLVCDNGSRDRTRELVHARQARSTLTVQLVDASARPGAGYARNIGVQQAAGDLVAFCDADDVVDEGWLAAMQRACTGDDVIVGRQDTERFNPRWARIARPVGEGVQESPFLPFAGGGNLAMRTSVFLAVGGFNADQVLQEDVDFSWRVQLAGYRLVYEPDALIHIRLRQSISGIYQQGFDYGRGLVELEARYGIHRDSTAQDEAEPAASHGIWHQAGTLARLVRPVVTRPGRGSLGHALWQLGWHMGHRAGLDALPAAGDTGVEPSQQHSNGG